MWVNHFVFLAIFSPAFPVTSGQDQVPGDGDIKNCRSDDNTIDIQENQNNTLVCEGFNDKDTIVWFIQRDGSQRTPVATCGPSNCTVHQPEHFAVQRSPSHSLLFYQQYDRDLDKLAKVICESQLADMKRTKSCTLNVINPATLSQCAVETDNNSGTARGSCRFEDAFSFSRPYMCTWYLEKINHETTTVTGTISITAISSSQFKSGVCTFSTTLPNSDPTTYSYSISFYPGTGKVKVNITNTGSETSTVSSTRRGIVSSSTTISTVFGVIADEEENKEKSSPVAAIVGGCIGGVVVIVAAVVIIAIVVKRRDATYAKPRRRQIPEHVYDGLHTTNTTTSTTANTTPASETTISDLHNIGLNDTQNKEKTRNAHHNPVYVNEEQPEGANSAVYYNQVTLGYSDSLHSAHDYCNGDHNSNPYYSEIKE